MDPLESLAISFLSVLIEISVSGTEVVSSSKHRTVLAACKELL